MGKKIDVVPGEKFGDLTIIHEIERYKKKRYFLCRCSCGEIRKVRFIALRAGEVKSCGCKRDERNRTANLLHGQCRSKGHSPLYSSWHDMKQRCTNPNSKAFPYYGGRGITVFHEWMQFTAFETWALKNGYKDGLTIERKDVNGNYCPENCEWIPQSLQCLNTRRNLRITYKGNTQILKQWAEELNIPYKLLQRRIKRGWGVEKAFETPLNIKYSHGKVAA